MACLRFANQLNLPVFPLNSLAAKLSCPNEPEPEKGVRTARAWGGARSQFPG
jgi:hypothetical protein